MLAEYTTRSKCQEEAGSLRKRLYRLLKLRNSYHIIEKKRTSRKRKHSYAIAVDRQLETCDKRQIRRQARIPGETIRHSKSAKRD